MTTLTEKTIGQIFEKKSLKSKFLSAMNEAFCYQKNLMLNLKEIP